MSPAFSPDGARIAYTTVNPRFEWDTWAVPVSGGEPQLLLKNASGLMWTGLRQVLFSEIKMGVHMAVVTAEESRIGQRDVYVPQYEPGMAHRSYLSPDKKWVLLVEMDNDHLWLPCRVVPADGNSRGRSVGPPGGGCTVGAWSPDGKWMYFTSNAVGANHIWRQRFPDGPPEQVTSGPTEEEGIAMAPDGRSFVTAVAFQNTSVWVHDSHGDRQVSPEGNAASLRFTPNGKQLLYRTAKEAQSEFEFYRDLGEVRVIDLESGRSEPLVPGFQARDYDISADGLLSVLESPDDEGKPRLWIVPLDHSAAPRQIPNVEGGSPRFGSGGEIIFFHNESHAGFVYRVRPDGTGLKKAFEQPVLMMGDVSRDGKWIEVWAPLSANAPGVAWQAFPLGGGSPIPTGNTIHLKISLDGRSTFITSFSAGTYVIPLPPGEVLQKIPVGGFQSEDDIAHLPGAQKIDQTGVVAGPSADIYAFYRGTNPRSLYRIPVR
jgi:Tol biopolymer transport system component